MGVNFGTLILCLLLCFVIIKQIYYIYCNIPLILLFLFQMVDKHGISVILAAIWEGHTDCVKTLLKHVSPYKLIYFASVDLLTAIFLQ